MDLIKLKQILIDSKIFVGDKPKNYLCKCYLCGDHPNPKKQGHLYVSKNPNLPICHCWFCGAGIPIVKLIKDLTGDKQKYKEVISDSELESSKQTQKKYSPKNRSNICKLPLLDINSFATKRQYIRERTNNQIEIEKIPGLIFNFLEFINVNKLDIVGEKNILTNQEVDYLQKHFVGFLNEHHTMLYCRNTDKTSEYKFKKVIFQQDSLGLLDYWSIKNEDPNRDIVVLAEANFNILGEYNSDSLKIKDKIKVYASGNGFNYDSLLKSVCFDHNLFKANVIILSDNDKKKKDYHWFLKNNNHIIKSCKIYVNKTGKDFGIYPQVPISIL